MEYMCAQNISWLMPSSDLYGVESGPILTPREKSPKPHCPREVEAAMLHNIG